MTGNRSPAHQTPGCGAKCGNSNGFTLMQNMQYNNSIKPYPRRFHYVCNSYPKTLASSHSRNPCCAVPLWLPVLPLPRRTDCRHPQRSSPLHLLRPQYAAIELGYFEEEGIDLTLVNAGGADKVMTSLISGDAQIGFMGSEASIYVYQEGSDDPAVNFAS